MADSIQLNGNIFFIPWMSIENETLSNFTKKQRMILSENMDLRAYNTFTLFIVYCGFFDLQ